MPKFRRADADTLVSEYTQQALDKSNEYVLSSAELVKACDIDAARVKKKMEKWLANRHDTLVAARFPYYETTNECILEEMLAGGIQWEKEIKIKSRSRRRTSSTEPSDLPCSKPSKTLINELAYMVQRAHFLEKKLSEVFYLLLNIDPPPQEGVETPISLTQLRGIILNVRTVIRGMLTLSIDFHKGRSLREEQYYRYPMADGNMDSILTLDYLAWHRVYRCHREWKQLLLYSQLNINKYIPHVKEMCNPSEKAESMYIY